MAEYDLLIKTARSSMACEFPPTAAMSEFATAGLSRSAISGRAPSVPLTPLVTSSPRALSTSTPITTPL